MAPIPEELVEETWQEVSSFASGRMIKEMAQVSKSQPELLAFMMEFVQDLDQEVKELAVYMFYVIFRMFQKSSRKRIKKISTQSIIECYEKNEDLIQSLEGIHQKFLDRIARIQLSLQPYVCLLYTSPSPRDRS